MCDRGKGSVHVRSRGVVRKLAVELHIVRGMVGVGGVIFLGVGRVQWAKPTCANPMAVDGAVSILHAVRQHEGVLTTV